MHYDSPDRRGIDVALLYRKDVFSLENSVAHELLIYNSKEPDKRVYTRDQLVVSGEIDGEKLHLLLTIGHPGVAVKQPAVIKEKKQQHSIKLSWTLYLNVNL